MARMKRDLMIVSTLVLVMIITSACNQAYSQAPAATFTPVPQNLFASAVPTNNMGDVQAFATGTALAQLTTSPGAPTATPGAGITPQVATATSTPLVVTNPTSTSTLAVAQTPQVSGPTATSIPAGSRPATYTLQQGEFPFCIARRFNVDPGDLLSLSGLSEGVLYPPGTVLRIPQSGSFPGDRSLRNHPATYTVSQTGETVYSVACTFGDVDPALIASNNGISVGATLNVGQTLNIP